MIKYYKTSLIVTLKVLDQYYEDEIIIIVMLSMVIYAVCSFNKQTNKTNLLLIEYLT